jgi:NAD(P)-dependent dehydrogenase (short-subunit alcohol dehydrogenase family)
MLDVGQFSLEGKVALITGASRGIGKAVALAYARAGADVIVVSRKLPDLELVAEEIKKIGRKSLPLVAHIGRLDQIQNLVEKTYGQFGKIDILVNNAATGAVRASALEVEERAWDSIMNLNLKGLFFLSQATAKVMMKQKSGNIINISSVDGLKVVASNSPYNISKAAVIMATKVMALEWAKYGIRVNCVAPGLINTRLTKSRWDIDPEDKTEILRRILFHRVGEPEDITGLLIFLASSASNYVTGETITVDGGYMLT